MLKNYETIWDRDNKVIKIDIQKTMELCGAKVALAFIYNHIEDDWYANSTKEEIIINYDRISIERMIEIASKYNDRWSSRKIVGIKNYIFYKCGKYGAMVVILKKND